MAWAAWGLTLTLLACSHEVVWRGDEPAPKLETAPEPSPLVVAVRLGSFDNSRLPPLAVLDRFASQLRQARLFQGVMYPIPPGVEPTWEIELSGSDETFEPGSNRWKWAISRLLPPTAPFVTLRSDYTLRLEALVVRDRVLVKSYVGTAPVQTRRDAFASDTEAAAAGMEFAVAGATRQILNAIGRDLIHLEAVDEVGE